MTENKDNRWFYNYTEQEILDYRVKEKDHIKIITRFNPDVSATIKYFKELFPNCKMAKRIRKKADPENVLAYGWNQTPYDNTNYGDEYNIISFIIIKETDKDEFYEMLKNNFDNYVIRKASNFTYTLKFDQAPAIRGIWKDRYPSYRETYYPVAILSFGRYNDYGRTHKLLTNLKIPHYLFVEPFEHELYSNYYNNSFCELIKAPEDFHLQNMGSTPMRNYILDYFKERRCVLKRDRVWLLDDNIKGYKRLYGGVKNTIESNEIFASIERYINQYDNVGIACHNFNPFITEGGCRNVICKNGKCYSSMLVPTNNNIRFEHKHQEDNFISIKYVCQGFTNLCFNHICYDKNTSGTDGGGNTRFIYLSDQDDIGRKERFDYSYETIKNLIQNNEIKLKNKKNWKDFIFHKPLKHEYYHIEFNYNMLLNFDLNDIVKKRDCFTTPPELYLDTGQELNQREELMRLTKEELVELLLNI